MKTFIVDTGKKKYIIKAKDAKRAVEIVKKIDDANISYIKICKVCEHYKPGNKGYCDVAGRFQVVNVANNCPYFKGEKYAFDRNKVQVLGRRAGLYFSQKGKR